MPQLSAKFFIIGPNAGKTGHWHGKAFGRGVWTFTGEASDLGALRHMLGEFYSTFNYADAILKAPQLFEPKGPYHGHYQASRGGDLSPGREGTAPEAAAPGVGDAGAEAGGERDLPPAGDGSERAGEAGDTGDDDLEDFLGTTAEAEPSEPGTAAEADEAEPPDEASTDIEDLPAAISMLDPGNSDHWTGSGLPALEFLASRVGEKVSRLQVNEIAPGYNRAAARRAKALSDAGP